MSWRQPTPKKAETSRTPNAILVRNFGYLLGVQPRQKTFGFVQIEQRIVRFNAKEEAVARGLFKSGHVEHRVIGRRKPAQRQQPKSSGKRRKKNCQLERDDDI